MQKKVDQLNKESDWGMQFLLNILLRMMTAIGDKDNPYKTYADVAKYYADGKLTYEGGIEHYWQSITDLQTMLAKEMDSWETIGDAAYTGLDGRDDAKKWLGDEVIQALVAEAEKRGWKKPA